MVSSCGLLWAVMGRAWALVGCLWGVEVRGDLLWAMVGWLWGVVGRGGLFLDVVVRSLPTR